MSTPPPTVGVDVVGTRVGFNVGNKVGDDDGRMVGYFVGDDVVGAPVGTKLGIKLGEGVVGLLDGECVVVGVVGTNVGGYDGD